MHYMCMLRRSLCIHLYPAPPCGNRFYCCTITWRSNSGNMAAGKGYKSYTPPPPDPKYHRVFSWIWIWKASQWVCNDQLANSSMPHCRNGGIVLLEKKIVSYSPIDWQDMWVHIRLQTKKGPAPPPPPPPPPLS